MAGAALTERGAGQAVESFGKPGQNPGSFKRWVALGGEPMTAHGFVDLARASHRRGSKELESDGRIMAKGLVVPGARDHLVNGLRTHNPLDIEGLFPVPGKDGADMSFVIAGVNGSDRGGHVDPRAIRDQVDTAVAGISPRTAGENVERAAAKYDLVPFIPQGMEESVVDLLGPRFGWDLSGVIKLQKGLAYQLTNVAPEKRTRFGTFVVKHGDKESRVVGATIIEGRLFNGVFVGESTEWGVDLAEKGNGVGPAAKAATDEQAIRALGDTPHAILGELNTSSKTPDGVPPAVAVGIKTGMEPFYMETAEGEMVPQILTHHVGVGDGNPVGAHEIVMIEGNEVKREFPVRAFLLTHLPAAAERTLYSPQDSAYIHDTLIKGERSLAHAGYPRTRTQRS